MEGSKETVIDAISGEVIELDDSTIKNKSIHAQGDEIFREVQEEEKLDE